MSHQLVDDRNTAIYDNPSETPNARVMPGYPLFLAAVYKLLGDKYLQITAVRMLQVIISSLSTVLGFYFVRKVFKKIKQPSHSLIYAIYPLMYFLLSCCLPKHLPCLRCFYISACWCMPSNQEKRHQPDNRDSLWNSLDDKAGASAAVYLAFYHLFFNG